jgi:integrase
MPSTETTTADTGDKQPDKNFSAPLIAALKPGSELVEYADKGCRGLRLRVYPNPAGGKRSEALKVFRWCVRDKISGKLRWITIGPFSVTEQAGHVTLRQARAWLETLKEAHRGGTLDQAEAELAAFIAPSPAPVTTADDRKTFHAVVEEFYRDDIVRNRKRPEEARAVLDRDIIPPLGAKAIDDITTLDCRAVVKRVTARDAPVHAGKVLATLKQIFTWAQANGFTEKKNPAAPLKADRLGVESNKRDRTLSDDEIALLWKALDAKALAVRPGHRRFRPATANALRILLLSAARTGELLQARWEDVDIEGHRYAKDLEYSGPTWTIPVKNQKLTKKQEKTAKPFIIPLTPLMESVFEELRAESGESPWVMASPDSSSGHYDEKSLGHAMRRMLGGDVPALVLPGGPVRPHDLRRTARTNLGKLKVPPHIAERCLNHRLGRIIATYDQYDYLPERAEALALWSAKVERIVSPGKSTVAFLAAKGA